MISIPLPYLESHYRKDSPWEGVSFSGEIGRQCWVQMECKLLIPSLVSLRTISSTSSVKNTVGCRICPLLPCKWGRPLLSLREGWSYPLAGDLYQSELGDGQVWCAWHDHFSYTHSSAQIAAIGCLSYVIKSMMMIPPRSRSLIWRAISSAERLTSTAVSSMLVGAFWPIATDGHPRYRHLRLLYH